MNIFIELCNIVGTVLYTAYDVLLLSCIIIIYPFESLESNMIVHTTYRNACNNYCNDVCYDISWKMCEIVTVVQIFNKKTLVPTFHRITNNYFRNINAVSLIKNGVEIRQFATWESFEVEKENVEFDLILYTKYNETESKKNYTAISESCFKHPEQLCTHICDVNFIIFQLTTDNNKYDINLKEPQNFFVKDNTLKFAFFKWYMKKVYDVNLTEDFSVNYMTQDMSIANLHHPFYIKFNEDGVTSFSTGKPKPKENPKENLNDNQEQNSFFASSVREESLYTNIINSERLKEHCE
jgi:hypothetical protein